MFVHAQINWCWFDKFEEGLELWYIKQQIFTINWEGNLDQLSIKLQENDFLGFELQTQRNCNNE